MANSSKSEIKAQVDVILLRHSEPESTSGRWQELITPGSIHSHLRDHESARTAGTMADDIVAAGNLSDKL